MSAYTKSLIKTFLQQHFADIIESIADTNLFFPSTVAQLSVESENGNSDLAQLYNNYGGIKGDASNGVLLNTTEGDDRTGSMAYFRIFSSFKDFMAYYVDNIVNNPRYVNAGVLNAKSPEQQISLMVDAGYSTMSPNKYLAGGVKDRIDATRSLFPFGKVTSSQAAAATSSGSGYDIKKMLGLQSNICTT